MSVDMTESVVPLRRTDPAQIALQVRQEMHKGGVGSMVIDITEGIMVVERTAEAQGRLEMEATQQEVLGDVIDPMDVVMREGVHELRVDGLSLREAMFEAVQIAAKSGAAVAYWSCGNMQVLTSLGGFPTPLLRTAALHLLGAPVLESEHLDPDHLMGCVAQMQGALPIEVEHGLLIRLEDLKKDLKNVQETPQPYRRSPAPDPVDSPTRSESDGGGRAPGQGSSRPPVWFGG